MGEWEDGGKIQPFFVELEESKVQPEDLNFAHPPGQGVSYQKGGFAERE